MTTSTTNQLRELIEGALPCNLPGVCNKTPGAHHFSCPGRYWDAVYEAVAPLVEQMESEKRGLKAAILEYQGEGAADEARMAELKALAAARGAELLDAKNVWRREAMDNQSKLKDAEARIAELEAEVERLQR